MTDAIDSNLQAQVDRQLMEQGAFTPLELLLDAGRLMYSDYERWRRQDVQYLDTLLMGNQTRIQAQIEGAVSYARGIGLLEDRQEFYPWSDTDQSNIDHNNNAPTNIPLSTSADKHLHALLSCRYVPAQDAPQLDMFFDNPVVTLTNGIAKALANRDLAEAQRQLDQLYQQAPNHADLTGFDQLTRALEQFNQAPQPLGNAQEKLDFLQQITPLAKRLLSSQSRDLLVPLWRQFASTLAGQEFSAANPNLHSSYALEQAQDWEGVCNAVLQEIHWHRQAPLCLRLAQSYYQQQNRPAALTAWCHLCWHSPQWVEDALDGGHQPDPAIGELWQQFLDCEDELSLDVALPTTDFPAWLLLTEPGLVHQLGADLPTADTAGEKHYQLVRQLIVARQAKNPTEEMQRRRSLQTSNPSLFLYLKHLI